MTEAKIEPMTSPGPEPATDASHVLVVDDDRRLRDLLSRFLRDGGYRVTTAASAAEARAKLEHVVFDALVLDVMMPGESGLDFLRSRRGEGCRTPVLMLTARAEPADRISGLETGADDYLAKPFEPRELNLRLANILKRSPQAEPEKAHPDAIRFGPFTFRFDRGELSRGGEIIRITEREREILVLLGQRAGAEVSREELSGGPTGPGERAVDVQMNRLRRKVELDPANPTFLQTVRGVGYRLAVDA